MKTILSVLMLLLFACASNTKENSNYSDKQLDQPADIGYRLIHSFYNEDDKLLGNAYVKGRNQDVFTLMLITTENEGEIDTLYFIDSTRLISKKGLDAEVFKDGFYGYKVVMKENDYIVLNSLRDFGERVSDDITIEWDYDEGLFELMKAP